MHILLIKQLIYAKHLHKETVNLPSRELAEIFSIFWAFLEKRMYVTFFFGGGAISICYLSVMIGYAVKKSKKLKNQ